MSEQLQTKIDDAKVEGWQLESEQGDRAVMIKRHYGSMGAHILIFAVTFWSFGAGNVIYLLWKYFGGKDKKVVRVDE